jgi:hypothetical protein
LGATSRANIHIDAVISIELTHYVVTKFKASIVDDDFSWSKVATIDAGVNKQGDRLLSFIW